MLMEKECIWEPSKCVPNNSTTTKTPLGKRQVTFVFKFQSKGFISLLGPRGAIFPQNYSIPR